ncbi:MAG: NADH-quinone oxidoreductase subunit NuoK [Bdellovibrionales bacterium]|nr:NADH-quinone oxidoreductase subunit NuoK [Bdellovibrionales bacterium]
MQNIEAIGIGQNHYLILSAIIFSIGIMGVLFRKNIIMMLMSLELMLNAINLTFIAFGYFNGNLNGQIMVFFVMTLAAAEAAIGLAIAVMIYRKFNEVNIRYFEQMKG